MNGTTRSLAAVALFRRGWSIIPLQEREKKPAIVWRSYQTRRASREELEAWFAAGSSNIGIVTGALSGLVVLDIDPLKGGEDSLWALEQAHGILPLTPEVCTGSGGRHLYFQHPGRVIPNSTGALGPGLDVRGDGGYVVGPPSIHPNGRFYEWEAAHHPDDLPLALVPGWLLNKLATTPKRPESAKDRACIPEGRRNDTLARHAGQFRHIGLSGRELDTALLAVNSQRCMPPLSDDEVRTIAASVGRYPAGDDRGRIGDDPGLIKELADLILATDHFAQDTGGQLYVFKAGAY